MTLSWKQVAAMALLLGGALILQQTAVRWIAFGSVRPDLTLIALTVVSLRYGSLSGLYGGLFLGLVQDVYAIEALGANALAKCVVGYALGFFEEKIVKVMPATRVLLLGLGYALHDFIFHLAAGLRGGMLAGAWIHHSLPSAVYTLLLGAVAFYLAAGFRPREV
jgi:rod shape-determining protein MreD